MTTKITILADEDADKDMAEKSKTKISKVGGTTLLQTHTVV